MMQSQFIANGIPVVLGEYGAMRRDSLKGDTLKLHLASRAYYINYVGKTAKEAYGLLPFFWDAGGSAGVINRNSLKIADQQTFKALTVW